MNRARNLTWRPLPFARQLVVVVVIVVIIVISVIVVVVAAVAVLIVASTANRTRNNVRAKGAESWRPGAEKSGAPICELSKFLPPPRRGRANLNF